MVEFLNGISLELGWSFVDPEWSDREAKESLKSSIRLLSRLSSSSLLFSRWPFFVFASSSVFAVFRSASPPFCCFWTQSFDAAAGALLLSSPLALLGAILLQFGPVWVQFRRHLKCRPTAFLILDWDSVSMVGENQQLVTDEPVEVQDRRKITDHFRGIYRI